MDVDPWTLTSYMKLKKWLLAHGATKNELYHIIGVAGMQALLPEYGAPKPGSAPLPEEDDEVPAVVVFPKSEALHGGNAQPLLSTAPDTTTMEVMVPSPYYLQSTVMAADAAMLPPQRTTSKEEKERNYTEHLNKDTTCACH